MTQSPDGVATPDKTLFFISRAGADKRWAELIASVVREAGHEPIYQDEHFHVGQSFIDNMTRAAEADCTIAVLSPAYFKSEYCLSELNAALAKDPLGRRGRVIPVLVQPVEIPSLVGHFAYLDLVGVSEDVARQRLMTTLVRRGQADASKLSVVDGTPRTIRAANRNRAAMIERVRTIWITGFLQKSLFQEARIVLGLSEKPDAVVRPLDLLVKRPDEGERPLPAGTQIVELFDEMDQSLLILGAPGSGKTTLLLELTRDLLDRAERDPAHAIPVVFPLSTWAQSRKPFVDWLQDELNLRYDVPRKIAKEWIATEQVLPLLDGLDEVNAEHRAACVEAVNGFRRSHGFLPTVITSRTADNENLQDRLRVHGAALARPLTREQVNEYLTELGPAGEQVQAALRADSSLWDLLDSPLLLNVVTLAYAGEAVASPQVNGSAVERRDRLFELYVNRMLRRRAADRRCTPNQTAHWLSWLAYEMAIHNQTVFYLEGLQLDWLPKRLRWTIHACHGLVCGLVMGLVGWLAGWLVDGLNAELLVGLSSGLIGGLLMVLCSMLDLGISCVEKVRWSWPRFRAAILVDALASGLVIGLVFGLVGGLAASLVAGLSLGLAAGLRVGLLTGLGAGLMSGLLAGLRGAVMAGLTFGEIETKAVPNEGIRKSGRNALFVALLAGLVCGLVCGLGAGLLIGVGAGLCTGLTSALCAGVGGGLQAGGMAWLRHFILRLWLIRHGSVPWNYVRFLDYAADRILLRKVGGGYTFIHRMLLEWFAARYVESSVSGAKPAENLGLNNGA